MTSPAEMPWQDRIVEASERIDRAGGKDFTDKSAELTALRNREIFAQAQIPGTIAMCEGGGRAAPLGLLIETQNGWLVRVSLDAAQTRALIDLLNSC